VVVALAVTRDALPVKSWVFPGNTADVSRVEQVGSDLRGWNLTRAIFVANSGVNPEDNRIELSRACGNYLLSTPMGSRVAEIKKALYFLLQSQRGEVPRKTQEADLCVLMLNRG
jgi:hypothetical protein